MWGWLGLELQCAVREYWIIFIDSSGKNPHFPKAAIWTANIIQYNSCCYYTRATGQPLWERGYWIRWACHLIQCSSCLMEQFSIWFQNLTKGEYIKKWYICFFSDYFTACNVASVWNMHVLKHSPMGKAKTWLVCCVALCCLHTDGRGYVHQWCWIFFITTTRRAES